jgi:hypothetical protein
MSDRVIKRIAAEVAKRLIAEADGSGATGIIPPLGSWRHFGSAHPVLADAPARSSNEQPELKLSRSEVEKTVEASTSIDGLAGLALGAMARARQGRVKA